MISFWFLLLSFGIAVNGYKIGILVPDMAGSQVLFNRRVGEVLAAAGHNVTLIRLHLMDYDRPEFPETPGLTQWRVNGILKDVDYQWVKDQQQTLTFADDSMWAFLLPKKRKIMDKMMTFFHRSCEQIITDKAFMDRFKAAEFDVVFSHMYDFCPIGMIHVVKPKSWVWVNSGALMDYVAHIMGVPVPASYAAPIMSDAGDVLTFGQRLKSVIGHTITPIFLKKLTLTRQNEIFRKHYGADFPDLLEVAANASLVFVNSNELYDLPRPTLHKIVNIGGLGMKKSSVKELPAVYADKIAKADNVVVFTFGSAANASNMPQHWKKAFMDAFAEFPKTQFFVRYDINDLTPSPNVHLSKWLPQMDLLQNPKTRTFITHGGFNGLQEAILAGKPLIAIPLMGDQFRNGRIAEKHGLGIVLRKSDLTKDNIVAALQKILTDPKYQQAAETLNKMVLKKPIAPETLLIRWTEFIAEFNNLDNLKPMGSVLDPITYYNVDVYATFCGILFLLMFISFKTFAFVIRKLGSLLGFRRVVEKTKNE